MAGRGPRPRAFETQLLAERENVDAKEQEQHFIELMRRWLISLPFDLKVLYEVADNENFDRAARELALGAIVYVISPNDFIADRHDSFVSYCDDCLILRLALQRALKDGGDDADNVRSRFPEFFETLDAELETCKSMMADLYDWLDSKAADLATHEYKGKKVPVYLDDDEAGELLYEDGLGFTTEYPVEEETLEDKFKKASTILDIIRRRKTEEARTD